MGSANERRRYNVTSSLIEWAYTQGNQPIVDCVPTHIWKIAMVHGLVCIWQNMKRYDFLGQ